MTGRIPQAFIDDLLERTDLVELVQRHVPLKKSGSEFSACCPFHAEKTPSFYVSPQKQFYHCFGCGAHGTAITFLMEYENLSFPETIDQLAEWAGLEVPRESAGPETEPLAPLLEALEAASRFYVEQLRQTPTAITYLKARGIDGATARDFALGWAPAGTDTLARALGNRFGTETLLAAGLAARRDDGSVRDRFRARIVFPIRDRRGRVTGFGGRLIEAGEPKYLNSPESAVFHKGHTIYGLYEARRAETRLAELVVTEGYMDVVGLAKAGFHRAVACMGTALTRGHLELLFRQVPRLVLCFDGDAAGRRAAWRSLEQALPLIQGMREVRMLFLPEGEDPDSLVRHEGLEGWERRLAGSSVLSETFMRLLGERYPLDTAEGRSQCAHAAVTLIGTVTDPLFRTQLCDLVAEHTRTPPAQVFAMLGEPAGAPAAGASIGAPAADVRSGTAKPDRLGQGASHVWSALLARVMQWPQQDWRDPALERLRTAGGRGPEILGAILDRIQASPGITTARLLEHFREETYFPRLMALAGQSLGEEDAELSRRIALDSANRLFREHCRDRIRDLAARADRPLSEAERAELRTLQALLGRGAGPDGNRE
ncbi:MAG: DNA primase [Thioalkalivibrio sp.]|nr:MAG: DNA primase [Thioalkalivibrio sp.]